MTVHGWGRVYHRDGWTGVEYPGSVVPPGYELNGLVSGDQLRVPGTPVPYSVAPMPGWRAWWRRLLWPGTPKAGDVRGDLVDFAKQLAASQKPLPPDEAEVLRKNVWDLYGD